MSRMEDNTRRIVARFGGWFVKSLGDGAMAYFERPSSAIGAAREIVEDARRADVAVRAGVHAGEVERHADDVFGMTVVIAARTSALAGPSEILVTQTVRDVLVGSATTFTDRGQHQLKGVDGDWRLFGAE